MEIRGLACDISGCEEKILEKNYGQGFAGWGSVHGISLESSAESVQLCPEHLQALAEFLNDLGKGKK